MLVKLLKKSGQAAVVVFRDNTIGMLDARVVSLNDLPHDIMIGQEADISIETIQNGTEYGIEWGLLLDLDFSSLITEHMRNHGVWTLQDLRTQSTSVVPALVAMAHRVYAEMIKIAEEI